MNKRERAMTLIAAEVANEGAVTTHAIRLYVENRLSMQSFREAIARGMKCATRAIGTAVGAQDAND